MRVFAVCVIVALLAGGAAPASAQTDASFAEFAKSPGTPQMPGLTIVYLAPLGDPAQGCDLALAAHARPGGGKESGFSNR